jgi:hypothetical protein
MQEYKKGADRGLCLYIFFRQNREATEDGQLGRGAGKNKGRIKN